MNLFITFFEKTIKLNIKEELLYCPISEFIERVIEILGVSKYESYLGIVVINEWELFRLDSEGGGVKLTGNNNGIELSLYDAEIKDGDSLQLVRKQGRKFLRKNLFWIVVEFESKKRILEVIEKESTTPNDIIEHLIGEKFFQMPSYTDVNVHDINYKLVKKKKGKVSELNGFKSLKKNNVKCGDSLKLIASHVFISDETIQCYQKQQLPAPNGEGFYVKTIDGINGPYTTIQLKNLNMPLFTLVTNTPQYKDWIPLCYYPNEAEEYLKINKK